MAPEPVLTSSTITSAPAASFLLRIELTMSGITSTVEVTSRRAYMEKTRRGIRQLKDLGAYPDDLFDGSVLPERKR